ncbi:MAG: hypothetical protein COS89_08505 [Deltaproteobacteria bacterium CG07_land_8_20_14_0_80_38_7]|nr:MAG: hypothetical protein COS89_08505 [Deltaproteobacteria bacterium CG07_land_8_20_14_0_80_38_7]
MKKIVQSKRKFGYYRKLNPAQKRIYDKSDAIENVMLPQAGRFNKVIADLEKALDLDDLLLTQTASKRLVD